MSSIIDGRVLATEIREKVKRRVSSIAFKLKRQPCLAVVLVGDDYASKLYTGLKHKACAEVGIKSINYKLAQDIPQSELLKLIAELNKIQDVDGILIQLPLPDHVNKSAILSAIVPEKDVDGLTPFSAGAFLNDVECFVPSTCLAVSRLIEKTGISLRGKIGVVIGNSVEVGRPVALYMMKEKMTVLSCNKETKNLATYARTADVLVSATGVPHLVTVDLVKQGAIVIDVGISQVNGKVVGDIDFENVKQKAAWITPVPGGVGPVTVACLLENTVLAAELRVERS